jgi:hypothetical protein
LTSNGELKLKLSGFELTAASTSYGLTVTNGAENVKAGRGAEVLVIEELTNPLELITAAVFTEDFVDTTVAFSTTEEGGSKLKLGRPAILMGIGTAVSSSDSTSSSSRIRGADLRSGADILIRILPPTWALMGVLDTSAGSI